MTFTKRATGFLRKLEVSFQKNAFFYLLALRLIPLAFLGYEHCARAIRHAPESICASNFYWYSPRYINLSVVEVLITLSRGKSPDLSV